MLLWFIFNCVYYMFKIRGDCSCSLSTFFLYTFSTWLNNKSSFSDHVGLLCVISTVICASPDHIMRLCCVNSKVYRCCALIASYSIQRHLSNTTAARAPHWSPLPQPRRASVSAHITTVTREERSRYTHRFMPWRARALFGERAHISGARSSVQRESVPQVKRDS